MKAVTFEARGKEFSLRLSMTAMCRYQDRAGETIVAAIGALNVDGSDVIRARRIFWAGLSERMTEEEAGEIMDEIGLPAAFRLVGSVLGQCVESMQDEPAGNARPASREKGSPAT